MGRKQAADMVLHSKEGERRCRRRHDFEWGLHRSTRRTMSATTDAPSAASSSSSSSATAAFRRLCRRRSRCRSAISADMTLLCPSEDLWWRRPTLCVALQNSRGRRGATARSLVLPSSFPGVTTSCGGATTIGGTVDVLSFVFLPLMLPSRFTLSSADGRACSAHRGLELAQSDTQHRPRTARGGLSRRARRVRVASRRCRRPRGRLRRCAARGRGHRGGRRNATYAREGMFSLLSLPQRQLAHRSRHMQTNTHLDLNFPGQCTLQETVPSETHGATLCQKISLGKFGGKRRTTAFRRSACDFWPCYLRLLRSETLSFFSFSLSLVFAFLAAFRRIA